MRIRKLLIANRGEIAVRIVRAARDLGVPCVQVHSAADSDMLAVKLADESIEIGPPPASKSYLNAGAILTAARETGADAIHPGYGFLAESAKFAEACSDAGLIFVGPSPETIRLMGDKAAARRQAANAGVPTVPGSEGVIEDVDEVARLADDLGFPVMIKAAAGGGGRGIRIATHAESFTTLAIQASTEARSAFGDGSLYIEKVIPGARHIEVQILGDGRDVIHCWERECTLQRRRQKVWEEARSPALDDATREALCHSATDLAQSVGYSGAGTVEYLFDESQGRFHFIEMNTRIQVEHPTTEMITGLDLVAEMICIAGGRPLQHKQEDVTSRGHAIEVRLNAEDPENDFMPNPGTVSDMVVPDGPGVRFDHMLYSGYQVPPFYDSLLGKLIVHGETRDHALARLSRALSELRIEGIATTRPLFVDLLRECPIGDNAIHTGWLEEWLAMKRQKNEEASPG